MDEPLFQILKSDDSLKTHISRNSYKKAFNELFISKKTIMNVSMNRFTLTFKDADLEKSFFKNYTEKYLIHGRICHWIAVFFYSFLCIFDASLFLDTLFFIYLIRFGIVLPVFLFGFLYSFTDSYKKYWQFIFTGYVIITGSGYITMIAIAHSPNSYSLYSGIILCLFFGYAFIRLRALYACIAGGLLSMLYLILILWESNSTDIFLPNYIIHFLGINILGSFIAYSMEISSRQNFLLINGLTQKEEELRKSQNFLEQRVLERTAELKKANQEILEDMNQRLKLEAQLRQSQKMEAMGLMAGGVAHDLNNILSGIVSYPELLLLNLPENSPLRKPIKIIQESGTRAADVVADLLTVARGVAIGKEIANLNTLIEVYLNSAEHQKLISNCPSITFKTELAPDLLNINCSPVHIGKTLMNLIANASEAIENEGTVTISTFNQYLDEPLNAYEDVHPGEYAVLQIVDNGTGISSDDLERIFEPFYTKKVMSRSGTGLGLAIVWNTTRDHDGYINVKSSEKGTLFKLYYPVSRGEVLPKKDKILIKDYIGHGERILIIDDEERQRKIASDILTRLKYNVKAISSGKEAISYLKKETVDLVVLDMIMPQGLNGRETFQEIIKIHPDQKAIIASGFSETEEVKLAQQSGARKYIKKPYTLEKIGIAVKEELKK